MQVTDQVNALVRGDVDPADLEGLDEVSGHVFIRFGIDFVAFVVLAHVDVVRLCDYL